MKRRDFIGDFMGFTYNGIHSSDLGIVRVSDGSRYMENLLPVIQDDTVPVPGGEGFYYFGSQYTNKSFAVAVAFDSMSEEQFIRLGYLLGDKGLHELIFDERPYKKYIVKVSPQPTINYICFEEEGKRIYKGEGQILFTAFNPFGISTYKDLKSCPYSNKREWNKSVGLLEDITSTKYDKKITKDIRDIYLYNPGDIDTDFKLFLKGNFDSTTEIVLSTTSLIKQRFDTIPVNKNYILKLNKFKKQGQDAGIIIDTKMNLILGIDAQGQYTNNIYNQYIINGTFFKIPTNLSVYDRTLSDDKTEIKLSINSSNNIEGEIKYNYLYY